MTNIFENIDMIRFMELELYNDRYAFCNSIVTGGCDACEHKYLCQQIETPELKGYLSGEYPEYFI